MKRLHRRKSPRKEKYPPQSTIGFRFVGMKWWLVDEKEYAQSTREWCMSLTPDDIPVALMSFFDNGRTVRKDLIPSLLEQLRAIRTCRADNPKWRMYGSSILVVYDGADDARHDVVVKIIDFAHVFPIRDGGVDAGYIHGVDFMIQALEGSRAISPMPQVGGAHGNIGSDGKRLTKVEDKPTQFDTELAFYVSARDADDPLYAVMPDLIDQDIASSPRTMVLSDITSHVRAPGDDVSIMDVSWEDTPLDRRAQTSRMRVTTKSTQNSPISCLQSESRSCGDRLDMQLRDLPASPAAFWASVTICRFATRLRPLPKRAFD